MAKEVVATEQVTKYEKAQMIGARALQISMGAPFAIKLTDKELAAVRYNPIEIAKIEFERNAIPMRTIRPIAVPLEDQGNAFSEDDSAD